MSKQVCRVNEERVSQALLHWQPLTRAVGRHPHQTGPFLSIFLRVLPNQRQSVALTSSHDIPYLCFGHLKM